MARYNCIVIDPPWPFSDKLKMSDIKRGAESQYDVMTDEDIVNLDIKSIAADDAILVLWVPSSKLEIGLKTMKAWGFEQTQTFIWVKTKKSAFDVLIKNIKNWHRRQFKKPMVLKAENAFSRKNLDSVFNIIENFDLNHILNFNMGRLFRQTHEIALVGKRGKIYNKLENKSQRSVLLDINLRHSAKPEGLQERLELMFPQSKKLELFARRVRPGWECAGLECPGTLGEDIRDSIKRLKNL